MKYFTFIKIILVLLKYKLKINENMEVSQTKTLPVKFTEYQVKQMNDESILTQLLYMALDEI